MELKLFLLFVVICFSTNAQNVDVEIEWQDKKNITLDPEEDYFIPGFDDAYLDYDYTNQSVYYSRSFEGSANYSVTNVVYENVSSSLLTNVDDIPDELLYETNVAKGRDQSRTFLKLNPFVRNGNTVQRVVSFRLQRSPDRIQSSSYTKSNDVPELTNSIFRTGTFYKFHVEESGIHKIDRNFLNNLGFNVNEIDPDRIKIYSHGGKMLPLVNEDTPTNFFDPPEVPLLVKTENNSVFGANDEILFYAESTVGNYSEASDTHLNLYEDKAYYFITVEGEPGKRIQESSQPPGSVSETITNFDDFQFYEVDQTNIAMLGRRWFGDRFDITTQRNYEFNFPNLVTTEPVLFKSYVGTSSGSSSSMTYRVNGTNIGNVSLFAVSTSFPARGGSIEETLQVNNDNINVSVTYNKGGNPGAVGFLDYIRIEAKRELHVENTQFRFTYKDAENITGIGEYLLQNTNNLTSVWDITDIHNVSRYLNSSPQSQFSFKANLGEQRVYQAEVEDDYLTPVIDQTNKSVKNINLKRNVFRNLVNQFEDVDYLVITNNSLLQQGKRLASFRKNNDGFRTRVVSLEDIYQEFNSGKQDISAIRNFIRYIYENASSPNNRIKYVAFLGSTSVDFKDRIQDNNNIVPTFHSLNSFSAGSSSFMSDDFFAMMDPQEGRMGGNEMMDIAVGRILADDIQEATQMVDKIIDYEDRQSYASWRNNVLFVSDDVDHTWEHNSIQVALDDLADNVRQAKPYLNIKKIHTDAFEQISSVGGNRYPEVNRAITNEVELGVSVINYFGHGGEEGLAQERIVTQSDVQSWENPFKYNIFLTITCEFTKFDNPRRISGGELAFLNPNGGSVAMITTTRAISVSAGTTFNENLAPYFYDYDDFDESIADAVMRTKNQVAGNGKRIIFYLGDPALKVPYGDHYIQLTSLNDQPWNDAVNDTLKGLSKNKFKGEVVNASGQRVTDYNGTLSATVFDKRIERSTLGNDGQTGNDGELLILDFTTLGETLFRGQASISQGEFEVEFVLPRDTRVPVDNGRISMYAVRDGILEDQVGYSNDVLVGGINEDAPEDNQGPEIQLFMNDESFVDGGTTNNSPYILANLYDENGINTAGGIGHDIVAVLDGDDANPIVLNDYYESEKDDFTKGQVYYRLRDLEEGQHTIQFKAWDTYNNPSTTEVHFVVSDDDKLRITRVLNYPNPFTDYTEFWFNHNRPFEPLEVMVQVFTVSGKLVWTNNQLVNTDGHLSRDITWDGRDDFGQRIGKGVYIYKISVQSTLTNQRAEKYEKLVIL